MADEGTGEAPAKTDRPPTRDTLWKWLNSPFLLFLLSSVVLTTVTRIYTDRQAKAQAAIANRADVGKLLLELEYRITRLRQSGLVLRDILDGKNGPRANLGGPVHDTMINIVRVANGTNGYNPISAEFKDTHIVSLMQQIDLKSGNSDSNRLVRYDGTQGLLLPHGKGDRPLDETARDAGLNLGDGPIFDYVDPPFVHDALARIDILQVYYQYRRLKYLCAPDAPGHDQVLECQAGPASVDATRLGAPG